MFLRSLVFAGMRSARSFFRCGGPCPSRTVFFLRLRRLFRTYPPTGDAFSHIFALFLTFIFPRIPLILPSEFSKTFENLLTKSFFFAIILHDAAMAQLVEHILGKDEVVSSTLTSSSKDPADSSAGSFVFPRKNI